MKRNIFNSPRLLELKKHRRKIFAGKVLLYVFALSVIFAGLVYISRIPAFNIISVEIIGAKITDAGMIKAVVEKEIAEDYLWLFPKTNILLYPKNSIKNQLHNTFKRLKDINFSVKDNKILEVSVTERVASYIWCGDVPLQPDSKDKPKCYFLDDSGYNFDEAPYFSGEVYFKFYGSDFSEANFEKLISLKKMLEAMGLEPAGLYLEGNGDNIRIFLSAKNSSSTQPEIILKADADFQKVAENLEVALNTEPLQSNFKNKYSSLLYIDLRFGNKIYYKFH